MTKQEFINENGALLSRLEEVYGQFLFYKSQIKSQKAAIEGLKHEIKIYENRIEQYKENNKALKKKVAEQEAEQQVQSKLVPENFKIKNSFSKLVTENQEEELSEAKKLGDFLNVVIEEIDYCINQLSK